MKILLIGYGAMNQRVARLAEEKGHEIVGVIENTPKATTPYQQYQHIADVKDADVAIDFSNPNLLFPLLDEEFHLPLVVATTGEKEKLLNKLDELSQNMPVFFSANMSYGVYALTKILVNMKFYLLALMKRFKSRIVHNQKIFLRMVQYKQQNA